MYDLKDLYLDFPNKEVCLKYMFKFRYPDIRCLKCGKRNQYHFNSARDCFTCTCGQSHIYPRKGTILDKSHTPIIEWFHFIYWFSISPNIANLFYVLDRIDVSHRTAWLMLKNIRTLLKKSYGQGDVIINIRGVKPDDPLYKAEANYRLQKPKDDKLAFFELLSLVLNSTANKKK